MLIPICVKNNYCCIRLTSSPKLQLLGSQYVSGLCIKKDPSLFLCTCLSFLSHPPPLSLSLTPPPPTPLSLPQEMVGMVGSNLEQRGVKFLWHSFLQRIDLKETGPPRVLTASIHVIRDYDDESNNYVIQEDFDTVLVAVGRRPSTEDLCLQNANVKLDNELVKERVFGDLFWGILGSSWKHWKPRRKLTKRTFISSVAVTSLASKTIKQTYQTCEAWWRYKRK